MSESVTICLEPVAIDIYINRVREGDRSHASIRTAAPSLPQIGVFADSYHDQVFVALQRNTYDLFKSQYARFETSADAAFS